MKKSSSEQFREPRMPNPGPETRGPTALRRTPTKGGRLSRIRARADLMQAEFLKRDEATLTRGPDESEIHEVRQSGIAAGAMRAARGRGL